jgi:tight adherence protein B
MTAWAAAVCGAGAGLGVLLVVAGWRGERVLPRLSATRNAGGGVAASRGVWLAIAAGALAWLVTGWPAAAVLVLVAAGTVPRLFGRGQVEAEKAIPKAVAAWAEQLRGAMAAAAGVEQAIETTVPVAPGPIRDAVRVLDANARSKSLPAALDDFGDQVNHPSADVAVLALKIGAEGKGSEFANVLDRLAAISRDEVRMRERVDASRARLRTAARMLVGIVVVAVVVLTLSRSYLEPYATSTGQMVLIIVGAMFGAGIVALDRMSRIESPRRFTPRQRAPAR